MSFEHEVTVRFHEVDRAGIAFFGRVFEYCHEAFEELLVAADDRLLAVFDTGGWGMPLVHVEADYARPMRMGDRLRVSVGVDRLGERSVTFAFRVVGAEDGALRATVRHVHACVDLERFEGIPVPDRLRDGLTRLGLLEDVAGAGA
ncbi:MAG: acyl-CoA thioesterase [Myxococcota bacterium]